MGARIDHRLTIHKASKLLHSGTMSATQLLEQVLARIDQNGSAFTLVDADGARLSALESDRLIAAGRARSPLEGLPVSSKDLFDVEGQITTAGSSALRGFAPANKDAPVIAALRKAGAVIVGRTHMSEFAFTGLGDNPHLPRCGNPADESRVPGGSSSGAAVSVALGQCVAGLGTDTGGSVRIPASFCGLVGFKPTQSRISREGAFVLSPTQDSIGSIANSVSCCALIDQILTGTSPAGVSMLSLKGLRFAIPNDLVLDHLDQQVANCLDVSVQRIRDAGASVSKVSFEHFGELPDLFSRGTIVNAEAFENHSRLGLLARRDLYDPMVLARIDSGGRMSRADVQRLFEQRQRMISLTAQISCSFDALLLPTTPIVAPRFDASMDPASFGRLNGLALRNTSLFNFLDRCAISLPMQAGSGLPAGLMLVGEHLQDQRLLAVAHAVERSL